MKLLNQTLSQISPVCEKSRANAKARLSQLTMPHWALGRLMDLAEDLAGMTRSMKPRIANKTVVTMAGDHGVTSEGISLYPKEVTLQMVYNFVTGGAGINVLSRVAGARVAVVDMGVAGDLSALTSSGQVIHKKIQAGTQNMAIGPAMSREDAVRTLTAGIEVAYELSSVTDVFGTGEMGIGNTTPSSAIVAVVTGTPVEKVTGRGTGIDESGFQNKVRVIQKALDVNRPDSKDGVDILSKVGGFEIGGIAGLILGSAALRKPVVIDGFISTAGALLAAVLSPASTGYMISAHRSVEQGHRVALERLGKVPYLDLNLRLGEGTGSALMMSLIDGAVGILTEMATFEEAAVSKSS